MAEFTIKCNIKNNPSSCTVHIGIPNEEFHPLHFQQEYMMKYQDTEFSQEIMQQLSELQTVSKQNNVKIEDLFKHNTSQSGDE